MNLPKLEMNLKFPNRSERQYYFKNKINNFIEFSKRTNCSYPMTSYNKTLIKKLDNLIFHDYKVAKTYFLLLHIHFKNLKDKSNSITSKKLLDSLKVEESFLMSLYSAVKKVSLDKDWCSVLFTYCIKNKIERVENLHTSLLPQLLEVSELPLLDDYFKSKDSSLKQEILSNG